MSPPVTDPRSGDVSPPARPPETARHAGLPMPDGRKGSPSWLGETPLAVERGGMLCLLKSRHCPLRGSLGTHSGHVFLEGLFSVPAEGLSRASPESSGASPGAARGCACACAHACGGVRLCRCASVHVGTCVESVHICECARTSVGRTYVCV